MERTVETPGCSKRLRTLILMAIGLIVVAALVLIIWLGLTRPESSITETGTSPVLTQLTAEVVISDAVEINTAGGGVSIRIPSWYIKLVLRDPNLFPEAGEPGWSRPRVVNVEVYDENDTLIPGAVFTLPIEVCFTLQDDWWARYQSEPDAFQVQMYADWETPRQWRTLPLVEHADMQQLCGRAPRPALFALAVKELPPTPSPGRPTGS